MPLKFLSPCGLYIRAGFIFVYTMPAKTHQTAPTARNMELQREILPLPKVRERRSRDKSIYFPRGAAP